MSHFGARNRQNIGDLVLNQYFLLIKFSQTTKKSPLGNTIFKEILKK